MRKKVFRTKYVYATGMRCQACWKCVETCPKSVFGKVSFLFHKHAIIRNSENCIGCFKCVKACKYSVIGKWNLL
jgi:2-oxoglutarate ferredoxin oxidoreductase subunit delta